MPPEKKKTKGEGKKKRDGKTGKKEPPKEKLVKASVTVGWTPKAKKGQYYNVVESLDDIICPPVPQVLYTDDASRAPKEPPCCPASSCCYPPPYCPRQPGRRCC